MSSVKNPILVLVEEPINANTIQSQIEIFKKMGINVILSSAAIDSTSLDLLTKSKVMALRKVNKVF